MNTLQFLSWFVYEFATGKELTYHENIFRTCKFTSLNAGNHLFTMGKLVEISCWHSNLFFKWVASWVWAHSFILSEKGCFRTRVKLGFHLLPRPVLFIHNFISSVILIVGLEKSVLRTDQKSCWKKWQVVFNYPGGLLVEWVFDKGPQVDECAVVYL